jgi:hypothetical protein
MADIYREKVGSPFLALEDHESRTSAVEAIRALPSCSNLSVKS